MGTRPRPRQEAAAAAGGDGALEARAGTQADADALRHPRPSADDTTANQTTTSHRWCGRAGRERHDGKANDDEGSPRLQPTAHIRTLALH